MTPESFPASAADTSERFPAREAWPQPAVFCDQRVTIYHGDAPWTCSRRCRPPRHRR